MFYWNLVYDKMTVHGRVEKTKTQKKQKTPQKKQKNPQKNKKDKKEEEKQ